MYDVFVKTHLSKIYENNFADVERKQTHKQNHKVNSIDETLKNFLKNYLPKWYNSFFSNLHIPCLLNQMRSI